MRTTPDLPAKAIAPRKRRLRRLLVGALGVAAAGYGAAAAVAWVRYGRAPRKHADESDSILDHFMPTYDVIERHRIRIDAPASVTFAAAGAQQLMTHPITRAIFRAREIVMGSTPVRSRVPSPLLPMVLSIGWRILAETPGREVVVGAVTRPWEANVRFRGLAPDEYAAFNDPGYVKIIWSLRADPIEFNRSIFRTETRALATDRDARVRFRRYWAFASPGIWLIRRASLGPLKREAERRVTAA